MNSAAFAEEQLLLSMKAELQQQLETINRLVTEDIHVHQLQLAANQCGPQVSEDLQLLIGPSASLRLTLEAGANAGAGSSGAEVGEEVHTWTALLQLNGGAQDGRGYGALSQLLARYLLLCLKRQGQLDKVPEPGSASDLQLVTSESEDSVIEDWDEEEEDDSDEDELPPTVAVNMNTLSRFGPSDLMLEKKNFLDPHLLRAVRKLTRLHCGEDPAWTLQLLEEAAPRLHELQLVSAGRAHLQVLGTMRHLNKLDVQYYREDWGRPPQFFRVAAAYRGLEWLRVAHLPEDTTMSLVRAHRRTLRELWLGVGTWEDGGQGRGQDPEDEQWPVSCRDLASLLARCRLLSLWRLVLFRWLWIHSRAACSAQRAAVRDVLPGVTVLCYDCDRVQDVSL